MSPTPSSEKLGVPHVIELDTFSVLLSVTKALDIEFKEPLVVLLVLLQPLGILDKVSVAKLYVPVLGVEGQFALLP